MSNRQETHGTTIGSSGQTAELDEIRIGLVVPLTGRAAHIGNLQKKGAELAVKQINSAGGILEKPVKLIFGDTEAKPDVGVQAFKRLVEEDHVQLICGTTYSSVALQLMDQAVTYGIPYISRGPSEDYLTDKYRSDPDKYWMFFRCTPLSVEAYSLAWKELLDFIINKKGWWTPHNKKYSIITEQTNEEVAIGDFFDQTMANWGWEQANYEKVPKGESDFTSPLTKIKTENPSVVLVIQTHSPQSAKALASLTKQFRELKINALLLSGFVAFLGAYKEAAGDAATGVLWCHNLALDAKLALGDPKIKEFADSFRKVFDEEPIGVSVAQWEQIYLIKAAYEAAGKTALTNSRAFCSAFGNLDVTLVDRYQFLPDHHPRWGPKFKSSYIAQIRTGKDYHLWPPEIVKEPSWETPPWITE